MKLAIINGRIVTEEFDQKGHIIVENDQIVNIIFNQDFDFKLEEFDQVIDATDKIIMPGGIDPHVHFDMPFQDFFTCDNYINGSKAAVAGGTTFVIDYPTQSKSNVDLKICLDDYFKKAATSYVDYGFHMILVDGTEATIDQLPYLIENGITSVKLFTAYKGKRGLMMDTPEELIAVFEKCNELRLLPQVHCEAGELIDYKKKKLVEVDGITKPCGHPESRPPATEAYAVHQICATAEMFKMPVYIVHNTSKDALDIVRHFKERGNDVIAECNPIHCYLDKSRNYSDDFLSAANHVLSPPLRSPEHPIALRQGIADGTVSVLASDHCAFNNEKKSLGINDFRDIPNGSIGVEERIMTMYTLLVKTGMIDMKRFVQLVSTNAAKILGIYPQKGTLLPGSDADIVIFDPLARKILSAKTHFSNTELSPWEGFEVAGTITHTIVRGEIMYQNGEIVGQPKGRYVSRGFSNLFD
eukprot:TRINITY_DN214_c0_g1_i1.p1 TRINITY_DN214_c0_g1~~TRINITY_DN214_c0_g1_i1.p1  ORF type:complete len:483 (+),score=133.27 TRINITY_DN214_c0_g1_i1:40-1449(+)